MEMTQKEMLELAGVVLMILLGGIAIAILIARTSVTQREARHRKISASRRAQNTSYDLLTAPDKRAEEARSGSRKRRRRKSHKPHFMIDILRHDEGGGDSGKPPAGEPEREGGSS